MSYWDTFVFFITASIHYSISAGASIINLHTHAELLTLMLSILLSFHLHGSGPQKATLPNQGENLNFEFSCVLHYRKSPRSSKSGVSKFDTYPRR